jgi:hypothetical protein
MWVKLSGGMFVPHGGDAGAFLFEQDEMSVPGHSLPPREPRQLSFSFLGEPES